MKLQTVLLLPLLVGLSACGQGFQTEEICTDPNGCTEASLNREIFSDEPVNEFVPNEPVFLPPPEGESEYANENHLEYEKVDPNRVVPAKMLKRALDYYSANKSWLKNTRYITVIDMSQHSSKKRLYLIDMNSGAVERHNVSHGQGSDKNNDGYAEAFSNTPNSRMTSLGIYTTAETYIGNNGYSLRLDGRSSTNSKARERAIVVHGASYVSNQKSTAGRSWGCPAVDNGVARSFIDRIKGGSVLLIDK